ncbi:MAG: TolC family protein, partial [Gemmatimonadetes bacterium]|nr:TolC family protein [Gemmatimonadota bacterium]
LPGVRLTGDFYRDKNSLGDLLTGRILWGVVGSITQPIFQSGLLRARSEARALELEAAWEEYRATILRAIGEVEDSLGRERSLKGQRDHLGRALSAAARNSRIQEERYRRGVASILDLLQARDQEMGVRRQVIAVEGEMLSNRISLALAVGVGFEEASQ